MKISATKHHAAGYASVLMVLSMGTPRFFAETDEMVVPLVVSSVLLFYAGMAFAYFVVFPMAFKFLVGFLPPGDPRFVSTVAEMERVLCDGPFMRRYEAPDDFGRPETSFNICTFWRIDALARDAKVNVDIHQGITGNVTLNAIDQTLPQLLTRIAKQVDMRFELDGPNLVVMPDSPFLKHYKVDYVNMARNVTGTFQIAAQELDAVGAGLNFTASQGVTEVNRLAAELARHAAVGRRFGIGAHFHAAVPVGPVH